MAWVTGHSILVPFMNVEGPLLGTYLNHATRPTYAIGASIRFRWIVPTGSTKIFFKLFIHGKTAAGVFNHSLIKTINNTTDWVADGTIVLHGITWDRYYHDTTIVHDIPGDYSICLANNGRHYLEPNGNKTLYNEADGNKYHHDAGFVLTPGAEKHHDGLPNRRELVIPTAGEKSRFEDEFVTMGQVEAGTGINVRYRTQAGVLSGYSTDPLLGFNLVFENGLNVGTDVVSGITLTTGVAISWGSETSTSPLSDLLFSDEPDWIYDAAMLRTGMNPGTTWSENSIPVHFASYESPTGKLHFSARTLHTGLYASHDNTSVVTQKVAAPNGTIGHIQFLDTADIDWTVTEADIDGHRGYRPGIVISGAVNFPAAYTWNISANGVGATGVASGATVDFSPDDITVVVTQTGDDIGLSSPLQIQVDASNVGGTDTITLDFDNAVVGKPSTHTSQVWFEGIDDTGGKRRIKAWAEPEGAGGGGNLKVFKSHWFWNPGELERISFSAASGIWNGAGIGQYYVWGFGGIGTAAAIGNYEKIIQSSTVINESTLTSAATIPVLGSFYQDVDVDTSKPENQYDIIPVTVTENGVYHINWEIGGQHDIHPLCENRQIGQGVHYLDAHLILERESAYSQLEHLDKMTWHQWWNNSNDPSASPWNPGNTLGDNDGKGQGDSARWEIGKGTMVYLQAGDKIYGLVRHTSRGDNRRIWSIFWSRFDMHQVYSGTPSTAVSPHGLSNLNFTTPGGPLEDGALQNWDYDNENSW